MLIDPDEIIEHEDADQPRRFASACPNLATADDDQYGLSHLLRSPDQLRSFVLRVREAVNKVLGGAGGEEEKMGGTCPMAPDNAIE